MGCNTSAESQEDAKWNKELQKAKVNASKVHKLLLLGTGNSGKSTFFKQLTQIHGGGFQDDEFNSASKHIQDSVVVQMKNLLNTFKSPENDEFKMELPQELLIAAKKVSNLSPEQPLSAVVDDIQQLWAHQVIKDAYINRTNLGIADSAPHFLDDLDRIKAPSYRPTPEDILLARIPTTGMRDKKFTIKGSVFNIFDVGGQRSERNKWIHCFDTVHGILFVASLSCYDQNLYEENELNAMDEALELFSIVVNSRYFSHASMILFLNKSDLFQEKIKTKPLTIAFPEYEGDNSYQETVEYITMKFKEQVSAKRDTKSIYTHVTCATDQNNVKKVFDDVQHAVVTNALRHNGLI